jgi:hypothetical protein
MRYSNHPQRLRIENAGAMAAKTSQPSTIFATVYTRTTTDPDIGVVKAAATRLVLAAYGEPPFLETGDFSTPNEAYFAHADWDLRQAEARGLKVVTAMPASSMREDRIWRICQRRWTVSPARAE